MEDNKIESIIFGYKETIKEKDAEIERLTEEANIDTITHIDICTENFSLRKQNAELKKQVDELKKRESSIIEYVENNVRNSCPKCKEQAVNDTAREIFTELLKGENVREEAVRDYYGEEYILSVVTVDKIKELAERYGVEVE